MSGADTLRAVTIEIPITVARELTPNASRKVPTGMKARLRKEYRDIVGYAAIGAGLKNQTLTPPLVVDMIRFIPKGGRVMDDDNVWAWFKLGRDAIADIMGMDDKHITQGILTQERAPDGVGSVVVTLREVEWP